jgi:cytochrome c553
VLRINALSAAAVATSTPGEYMVTSTQAVPANVLCSVDDENRITGCPGVTVLVFGRAASLPAIDPKTGLPFPTLRLPLNAAVAYYSANKVNPALNIPTSTKAEDLVSLVSCNKCHMNLSAPHGSSRAGSLELCGSCHNTEATWTGGERPAPVGKKEISVDFKTMIHEIHNGQFLINGEAATYPMPLANCQACHVTGGYSAPPSGVNGTTTTASATDAAANLRTTPWYATCGSCHSPYGPASDAHMQQMGGGKDMTQAQIDALMFATPPALKIQ